MLVVEFADQTRAVLRDDIAQAIVGLDVDGDLLVENRPYRPAVASQPGVIERGVWRPGFPGRPARAGELRPLTPCCHQVAVQSLDYKSGAMCNHCGADVDEKFVMAAQGVYTGVSRLSSIEEAVRDVVPKLTDDELEQVVKYMTQHCVAA